MLAAGSCALIRRYSNSVTRGSHTGQHTTTDDKGTPPIQRREERCCRARRNSRRRRDSGPRFSLYRAMYEPPRSNFIMIYVKIFHDAALALSALRRVENFRSRWPLFHPRFASPSPSLPSPLLQHVEKYLALVRGLARGRENKLGPLTRGLWGARPKFNAFPGP